MLSTSPLSTLKHAHTCTETSCSTMLEFMYDGVTCTLVHYSSDGSTGAPLAAFPYTSTLGAEKWHDLCRP